MIKQRKSVHKQRRRLKKERGQEGAAEKQTITDGLTDGRTGIVVIGHSCNFKKTNYFVHIFNISKCEENFVLNF